MITNIKSLMLELNLIDARARVDLEECGIMVRTSAWICRLRFPFRTSHLHIILGV